MKLKLCLLLIWALGVPWVARAQERSAQLMRATHASLQAQLGNNQFNQPVVLVSAETPDALKGDIYAVINYSMAAVKAGLNNPARWCDVMLLHINTKYCHAQTGSAATRLSVNLGSKKPEELSDATRVDFDYRVLAATPDYLAIGLDAKEGPMGTSNFRIQFEALALPDGKSFIHMGYSYRMNFAAQLAMSTYLGTVASGKVGFTVLEQQANGQNQYIGGMRGLVERNTMRYYLAINAYLEAATAAPGAQFERRLQNWFTAVEQYPRQLHEMDRQEYLAMKRAENQRQLSMP